MSKYNLREDYDRNWKKYRREFLKSNEYKKSFHTIDMKSIPRIEFYHSPLYCTDQCTERNCHTKYLISQNEGSLK